MKRILVTGAGGLVGYDVAKALQCNHEYDVFVACHSQQLAGWKNVLHVDLENVDLEGLQYEFDYIVHCAALIPNNIHSDEQAALANRRIDDRIINYCCKHKCRLIYISTMFQNNKAVPLEGEELYLESKYKYEKRQSEIKIENQCSSFFILRIPSPYGPRQKNLTVLKRFITASYEGKDLCYFGSGARTQNFIDVRDIASAVLRCVECEKNGIVNIAAENAISMKQLADLVLKVAKNKFNTASRVVAENREDPQENVRVNIDISKAEEILGWKPQIEIEDGIKYWIDNLNK